MIHDVRCSSGETDFTDGEGSGPCEHVLRCRRHTTEKPSGEEGDSNKTVHTLQCLLIVYTWRIDLALESLTSNKRNQLKKSRKLPVTPGARPTAPSPCSPS